MNPADFPVTIPDARSLCTDLANANRIYRHFKGDMLVCADRWLVWCGTHWKEGDGEAYRRTCKLTALIEAEILHYQAAREKAASQEEVKAIEQMVRALEQWQKQSEMKGRLDSAFGILRKLLAVNADHLDADPWLLNVANGTVDLRTGQLRAHDKRDLITRFIPVEFDLSAICPRFERMLAQITDEADYPVKPIADFLRRWFGYAATGSIREQVFCVFWGDGANGKSTLLDAVADVLGPYAGAAAPKLLIDTRGERHPTEIADLRGRRMVVAHESGEGEALNEGFVKQATGGDKLKARVMRGDFFEFSPTHKLVLVTNHKPQVRGQDFGIWRRMLLVPFTESFGTKEQVAQGRAKRVRDEGLQEALRAERRGILAWLVRGALEWQRDGGLTPPDVVRDATDEYRSEQDRVGQWLTENCELDPGQWWPLTGTDGLYPAYTQWCKESGYGALGRGRFKQALEQRVPRARWERRTPRDSRRGVVAGMWGVRLLTSTY